jgi:hypothetical protein
MPLDHAADAHEKVEVAAKLGAINGGGMIHCVSKGDAVLIEVVAHRQLAAKGVVPLANRQLAQFVAKVGQHDDRAVDLQIGYALWITRSHGVRAVAGSMPSRHICQMSMMCET